MTDERFEQLLADHLAGELDDAAAAELHDAAAADSARAQRLRELEATERALGEHVVSLQAAEQRVATLLEPVRVRETGAREARSRVPALLRYAAVVLLAFVAGYVFRGWSAATEPAPREQLAERFVDAQREFPGSSQFAHSLLALARR